MMTRCDIYLPHPFSPKGYEESNTINVIERSNFDESWMRLKRVHGFHIWTLFQMLGCRLCWFKPAHFLTLQGVADHTTDKRIFFGKISIVIFCYFWYKLLSYLGISMIFERLSMEYEYERFYNLCYLDVSMLNYLLKLLQWIASIFSNEHLHKQCTQSICL
jgi:hypothetical protein